MNAEAEITLLPETPDAGILFEIDGTEIPAKGEFLTQDPKFPHTTILGRENKRVYTVEHLLAAVVYSGVNNLRVKTAGHGHMPFLDGSALPFYSAILHAGLVEQPDSFEAVVVPSKEFVYKAPSGARVEVSPSQSGQLEVETVIEFPDTPIGCQRFFYQHTTERFGQQLAPARTFAFSPFKATEATRAKMPGFWGLGAQANMIVWRRSGFLTPLRLPSECVRHKIVDFLGDLALAGGQFRGRLTLYMPGHALAHAILREAEDATSLI